MERLTRRWARQRRVAVLLVSDQRADRTPTACIKSGVPTDHAIRARAVDLRRADTWTLLIGSTLTGLVALLLRRPRMTVVLPVSATTWRTWRRQSGTAIVVSCAGAGLAVAGVAGTNLPLALFGIVVLAIGCRLRMRAWVERWVGLRLRHKEGEIVVSRVHERFDAEAGTLFVAHLSRDQRR